MTDVNRRDFLGIAGLTPLGLMMNRHHRKENPIPTNPAYSYDPWLEINTKNFAWNVSQVRKRVEDRPIMAVIKCNGYGHGLVKTARALEKQNIREFAVVKVQEALDLRRNGIQGMILNFGPYSKEEAEQVVRHNISQSVFTEGIKHLAEAARKINKQAKVHVKIDTGLGRVGVPYDRALSYIEKIASMPDIAIEGIFTTLTEEEEFDKVQIQRFLKICDDAKKKGISVGIKHAAASAAVATFPPSFLDMVRPGNCLYGLETLSNMDLKPVLSLKTRVIYKKEMHPGETVAYHRRYKIERDTSLATIPLGYSDGYPFQAVNEADVLINGRRFPLVAYMSANHVFVDVSQTKDVKIGDEVVLYGTQKGSEITLGEVAKWGESSVYKVAILMNPLIPRIYL